MPFPSSLTVIIRSLLLSLLLIGQPALADKYSSAAQTFRDNPGSAEFFQTAYGYAVFPSVGKAGLGIGGAVGKGKVYRQGTAIGTSRLTQLSVGFQVGGQAYSQIIFFKDARALQEFISGNFEFSAEANAVALTASASAQTGTAGSSASAGIEEDSNKSKGAWYKGMAVFTIAKGGLMYQAAIAGQKFSYKSF